MNQFTLSPDGRVYVISEDGKRLVEKQGPRFLTPFPATQKPELDVSSLGEFWAYFRQLTASKGWDYRLEFAQQGEYVSPALIVNFTGTRTGKTFPGELRMYVVEFLFTGQVIIADDVQ